MTAMVSGAVLDPGEGADSPRAMATAGPGVSILYHLAHERGDGSVAQLPNGDHFAQLVDSLPPAERHLAVHTGHLSQLNEIDRQVLTADTLTRSPLLHPAADVPAWIDGYSAMGVTELAYEPMGDIPDALRRLAAAAGLTSR